MADENILPRDQNHVTTAGFENSLSAGDVRPGQIVVATGRIKVDASGGGTGTVTEIDTGTGLTGGPITDTGTISLDTKLAPMDSLTGNSLKVLRVNVGETAVEYATVSGTGTVTTLSVVSANGFAGTVANPTSTPAITLSTTITGILKGNGTAISAATAGSDYTALAFKTLSVSGQSDIVAATASDTLTVAAGSNVTITTNAGTKTLTIAASGSGGSGGNGFAWFIS